MGRLPCSYVAVVTLIIQTCNTVPSSEAVLCVCGDLVSWKTVEDSGIKSNIRLSTACSLHSNFVSDQRIFIVDGA